MFSEITLCNCYIDSWFSMISNNFLLKIKLSKFSSIFIGVYMHTWSMFLIISYTVPGHKRHVHFLLYVACISSTWPPVNVDGPRSTNGKRL